MTNDITFCSFSNYKSTTGRKVVYFEREEERKDASFSQYDNDILAVLVPDDNWRADFQEKYYFINFEIGSPASILDPLQFIPSTIKTFDVASYVCKDSIEDFYRVYSKTSMLKWLVFCIDQESFKFFNKIQSDSTEVVSVNDYNKLAQSKLLLEFTGYNRCAPEYVGVCLCLNIPILAVAENNFYDGYRNMSVWDDILTSGTCVLQTRYLVDLRALWFTLDNALGWIKPRLYYETFLGKSNLLKRLIK